MKLTKTKLLETARYSRFYGNNRELYLLLSDKNYSQIKTLANSEDDYGQKTIIWGISNILTYEEYLVIQGEYKYKNNKNYLFWEYDFYCFQNKKEAENSLAIRGDMSEICISDDVKISNWNFVEGYKLPYINMDIELIRGLARNLDDWQWVNWKGVMFSGYRPPLHCRRISRKYVYNPDPYYPENIIGDVEVGIFNPSQVKGCFAIQYEDCYEGPWDGFLEAFYFKTEEEVFKAIGEDGFIKKDLACRKWPNLEEILDREEVG